MKTLTIILTVISCALSLGLVVLLARAFGIPAEKLHGAGLEFSLPVMSLGLLGLSLPIGIIFLSQKVILSGTVGELGFQGSLFKLIGFGIVAGVLIHLLSDGISVILADQVKVSKSVPDSISFLTWLPYYLWFVVLILINSLSEELVYRCFPIQHFSQFGGGKWLVIISVAFLFSVMHYFTDSFSWSSLIYRFLFGVLMGIIYYETRSIWFVFGVHSGFNIIGMAVSSASWKVGGLLHLEYVHSSSMIPYITSIVLGFLIISSSFWLRWIKVI